MIRKKKHRRIAAFFLAVILATATVASVETPLVYAATTITVGTVNVNTSLNVRSGPGTNYGVLGVLRKDDQVTIIGDQDEGWYQISYNNGTAYVSKSYITNVHTVEVDDSYAEILIASGFPADYAALLSVLHSSYPNWVFKPVRTGLDWETVIDRESALGKNLVPSTNDDAQKSTASGAYNWSTNTWTGYDGSSWVCASREMVAYCMDPRNFLNAASIFQFATNEYEESQTTDGVTTLLTGSFLAGNYTDVDGTARNYPQDFVDIGSELNVNPYHLASRVLQEQGIYGTSGSISGTVNGYEGYFNYFNINAYPANGLTSVQNGLLYAQSQGWNSRYTSLYNGSKTVADNYVAKGQNTIYFEKFNVVNTTSGLYNHQYMTNVQAAISEGANMKKAYTDDSAAVTFLIPVYNDMPEKACSMPSGGNPNNWLKSLSVEGGILSPGFDGSVTDYTLIVAEDVTSVNINAQAVAATSVLSGTGTVQLASGDNAFPVVCTAANGTTRTYTIHVTGDENISNGSGNNGQNVGNGNQENAGGDKVVVIDKSGSWKLKNGKWYYIFDDGSKTNGFISYKGDIYYINEDGSMAVGWVQAGNTWYYMGTDGTAQSGWLKYSNKWYYLKEYGAAATGWMLINNKWYYFDTTGDGKMLTGWQSINNKWYYFGSSSDGAMKTGWQKISNKWYYLGEPGDGAMKTGWQKIGDSWYYFDTTGDGKMLSGWQSINNSWYYFGTSNDGAMKSGWQKVSGKWYYLGEKEDGSMKTGWQLIGGKWYYMYANGTMAANTWIGNYYVNSSGVWTKSK
ncbi:MAG: SH3 domain-containing protein [Roseburia sp.]